jgi:hypothetical protein
VDVVRQRLLAIDVLAGAQRGEHRDRVPVVGRGDADRVNVLAGDEFAEIVIGRAAAVPIESIHPLLRVVAAGGVHIADRKHPGLVPEEAGQQTARLRAHANEPHRQAPAGSDVGSPNLGWKDERRRCR